MELAFPHRIKYQAGVSSIDEVIESLKAQKRLIEEAAVVFEALIEGFEMDKTRIRVVRVAEASLAFDFLVLVYGAYQKSIEQAVVGGAERMFGVDIPEQYEAAFTLVVLVIVYWVARYAYDAVRRKRQEKPAPIHIEGSYNTVINIAAENFSLTPAAIENVLSEGSYIRA